MIELTVKTLDSQNHQFSVEDDITVEQFKAHIADTVNIPAETQRIIYCGRVLQDSAKLSDYDVHGKVVHLVQRAPPSQTSRSGERSSSPQAQQRRIYRPYRMEQGNAMYLGSMAFPGNLMESQGIVPPPPTHSLSGSRLNVARRMLRRAEAVIQQLENPSSRPQEQPANEETQEEEEVTPVIEARVIVSNNNEPIDDVLNAVQNTLMHATAGAMTVNIDANTGPNTERSSSNANSATGSAQRSPNQSETSTPGGPTPRSSSTENLSSDQRSEPNSLPENALRTTEMSDLLTLLGQLQARFAPHLAYFHNFMQQDPEIAPDQVRSTQLLLNRVSEVMHFFSHAYHSLSDIIVRVRTPPARPLLCRPILIQHSAVLQTGIPIQVEAQINLSADRPPSNTAIQSQSQQSAVATSEGTTASTEPSATQPSATASAPTISVQSGFVGLPFLPGTVRVQSIPIEIRNVRPTTSTPRTQNNNNTMAANPNFFNENTQEQLPSPIAPPSQSGTPSTQSVPSMLGPTFAQIGIVPPRTISGAPPTAATNIQPSAPQEGGPNGGQQRQQQPTSTGTGGVPLNFNNPNVEFFMEVTPEGITIDSLETTLVGSNQANDFLRGALNGPTPEFLQSIMRMAGQIITQNIATTSASPQSTATTTTSDTTGEQPSSQAANSQASSAAAAAAAALGQNSQARGNTQTNPTTATSTRSTPRPHVHLAQQAMQGGFDPFLPCNSHHISRRRAQVIPVTTQRSTQQSSNSTQSSSRQSHSQPQHQNRQPQIGVSVAATAITTDSNHQRPNVVPSEMGNILELLTRRLVHPGEQPSEGGEGSQGNASMAGDSIRVERQQMTSPHLLQFFSRLSTAGNMPEILTSRVTLEQVLQQFQQDDQYVPGESIFTDLIMIFVRNLTLVDLITLNSGNTEPINRNINEIQNFFRTRICDGNISSVGIDRGTERLIAELQPFLDSFSSLPARDDINMVRSAEQLFRIRLPNIISTAVNLNSESVRSLFDQCVTTAKQLLALTLYVSVTGQTGVEQIYDQLMNRFMQDVSPEFQSWTLRTSRFQLRQVLSNLNIPESELQPYIVLTTDPILQSRPNIVASEYIPAPEEAMELDTVESQLTVLDVQQPAVMLEDPEPLPNVIMGSEPWHGQVPEDWVPIITRDAQKQRRQNPQGPFSDAYLSGMPSKRRKIVNSSKPQGSLPQVISDSVRQAVTATGLASVAPLETVAQAAGSSPEIQNAYRNLLRTTVQSNLRDNEDYVPERFPNISNYFNGNHQPQ